MKERRTYIDGYNLLRKLPRFNRLLKSNGDAARRGFVEYLRTRRTMGSEMIIVFDGHGEPISSSGGIQVVFSLTRTADGYIRMRLEEERRPAEVGVVSDDSEVRSHAKMMGARVHSTRDFSEPAVPDELSEEEKPPERSLSNDEINEWMRLFQKGSSTGK